jgi:hypothetical protein
LFCPSALPLIFQTGSFGGQYPEIISMSKKSAFFGDAAYQ